RVRHRDEPRPFGSTVLLPELERRPDRDLDRGRSVVAVEHAVQPGWRHGDQAVREPDRGLVSEAGHRYMRRSTELPFERLSDSRVTVPEVGDPPGADAVDESTAVDRVEIGPLRALDDGP